MWFRNILLFNSLQVLSGWACVTCRNGDTIDGMSSAFKTPSLQYFSRLVVSSLPTLLQELSTETPSKAWDASCCTPTSPALFRAHFEWPCRSSGSELRATFIKGKAQGQGLYTYNDGSRYVGQFVNSQRDGTGIYKFVECRRCSLAHG